MTDDQMVEVPLTELELQKHPIAYEKGHYRWAGRRAFFWDMELIEKATQEQLNTLEQALDEHVDELAETFTPRIKQLIIDYEIIGSYAFGNQTPFSDLDIQLTASNEEKQRELMRLLWFENWDEYNKLRRLRYALSRRLKHTLDIKSSWGNNKAKGVCYSLKERKLYGRQFGVPMTDTCRVYDINKQELVYIHRPPKHFESIHWNEDGSYK